MSTCGVEELVRDVLETHRGDWLTVGQTIGIVQSIRPAAPTTEIRNMWQKVRSSSSIESRRAETVRWHLGELRAQQVTELRAEWPQD